ncbi:MAG TPA: hypothetical protein VFE47_18570 [Tepidisphaeraceae bacterium]|jgi:hypothetical protein|nr:hypothetical protein [Tepidisphaeraceae bacterium]
MRFRFPPLCFILLLLIALTGCQQLVNPSFPTTPQQADVDLNRMAAAPKKLDRPLVIVGGFIDPGVAPIMMKWMFQDVFSDDRVIGVPMGLDFSFDGCRDDLIKAVDERFPCKDPNQTTEVDVIGMSMGGLVARYSASPIKGRKRLNIARLFTISSPLQGADSASRFPALHPLMTPMRAGSPFLTQLNATMPSFPVYSYVRLYDHPVGAQNAALPGRTAWWVSTPWLNDPHNGAFSDERILADIARRLRDEAPLAKDPPAPLPAKL